MNSLKKNTIYLIGTNLKVTADCYILDIQIKLKIIQIPVFRGLQFAYF